MIISTLTKKYAVIRLVESGNQTDCFLCEEEDGGGELYLIVCIKDKKSAVDFIEILTAESERPEYSDLQECFISDNQVYAVFTYGESHQRDSMNGSVPFLEKAAGENCLLIERLSIVRTILEKMIMQDMPCFFQCDCLSFDHILVNEDLSIILSYNLSEYRQFQNFTMEHVCGRVESIFKLLFEKELRADTCGEFEKFMTDLKHGRYDSNIEILKSYLYIETLLKSMPKERFFFPETKSIKKVIRPLKTAAQVLLLIAAFVLMLYMVGLPQKPQGEEKNFTYIGTVEIE